MLTHAEESVLYVGAFLQEKKYALHHQIPNPATRKTAFKFVSYVKVGLNFCGLKAV
jgi:hypothetical protein